MCITSQPTNKPLNSICKEIEKAVSDKMFGNLHIFVNSVDFIISAISESGLTPEQVKIVCADNKKQGNKGKKPNQRKIDETLGEEFVIGRPLDNAKKVNFYTSMCFEGCDIYDEYGKTFIVSDGKMAHTQLDIKTLLIQICGRVRNSIYKKITHIFSYTRYNGTISLNDYEQMVLDDYHKSEGIITEINNMSENARKKVVSGFSEQYCSNNYISVSDNKLHLDKNLLHLDIVNFKIANGLYSSRVAYMEELSQNGLDHE